jgi:Tfp pilus assembly protein PilW
MKRDAGFSLVEVLMATTITLVVLGITASAFVQGLRVNNTIELLTSTNQNLQTGSSFLTQDLTKAGQDIPIGGISIPNGTGSTAINWPRPPTQSTDPPPKFPALASMNALTPGDALGPLVQDSTSAASTTRSDVITVIYADRTLPELSLDTITVNSTNTTLTVHYTAGPPVDGTQINITATNTNIVSAGDLFLFTNANGTTLQEVTASGVGNQQQLVFAAGDAMNLNQPSVALGGILPLMAVDSTTSKIPPFTIRRVLMVTYYIDRTTPTQPLLTRRINFFAGTPVAVGVENLQFTFDIYQFGVGSLTNVLVPTDPNSVRKVDVYMAARSEDKSKQTNNYLRNSMQTQITVRSLGLFDIYPGSVSKGP